jgi:bifunctional non-homologous end joining protein LigD
MLKKYREKRDFNKTPEPKGEKKTRSTRDKSLSFVVQEHAATRLHFDFRLEYAGILLSWAVPKGPSLNPQDKRLAVMTEDHPLDYANFEGIIPSGYGAGEVIVWDQGIYTPLDKNEEPPSGIIEAETLIKNGLKEGKLLFSLQGKKLQGIWTLVRMKKTEKDWLLIKHKDKFASEESHPWKDNSILSKKKL